MWVLVLLSPFFAGCSGLYPHDPETKKLTADALAALDKAEKTIDFDKQGSYLEDLWKQTVGTRVELALAARDRKMANLLNGTADGKGENSFTYLDGLIMERLKHLVGNGAASEYVLGGSKLIGMLEYNNKRKRQRDTQISRVTAARDLFVKYGGSGGFTCIEGNDMPDMPGDFWGDRRDLQGAYREFKAECDKLTKISRERLWDIQELRKAMPRDAGSLLDETEISLWNAEEGIRASQALAKVAKAEVSRLEGDYKKALEQAKGSGFEACVQEAAARIANFIAFLKEPSSKSVPTASDAKDEKEASKGEDKKAACATGGEIPKIPTFKEMMDKTGITVDGVEKFRKFAGNLGIGDAFEASLKKTGSELAESALGQVIAALGKGEEVTAQGAAGSQSQADKDIALRIEIARNLITIIGRIDRLKTLELLEGQGKPWTGPDALQVSLAMQRYRANQVAADQSILVKGRDNLNLRATAIRRELVFLMRANDALKRVHLEGQAGVNKEACKRSLNEINGFSRLNTECPAGSLVRSHGALALEMYQAALEKGELIIDLTQFKENQLLRERQAVIERNAAQAWHGALRPALAELAVYGEGGIPPELIARMLNVLGLAGIAYGVNQ